VRNERTKAIRCVHVYIEGVKTPTLRNPEHLQPPHEALEFISGNIISLNVGISMELLVFSFHWSAESSSFHCHSGKIERVISYAIFFSNDA
jgi:hypothetical protein